MNFNFNFKKIQTSKEIGGELIKCKMIKNLVEICFG